MHHNLALPALTLILALGLWWPLPQKLKVHRRNDSHVGLPKEQAAMQLRPWLRPLHFLLLLRHPQQLQQQ
jgi:hypothetical protein